LAKSNNWNIGTYINSGQLQVKGEYERKNGVVSSDKFSINLMYGGARK